MLSLLCHVCNFVCVMVNGVSVCAGDQGAGAGKGGKKKKKEKKLLFSTSMMRR